MSGFDINMAARMMRVGDEFSKTNEKLIGAVASFVEWLFKRVGEHELTGEKLGWSIKKEENGVVLNFSTATSGWNSAYSVEGRNSIHQAVLLCETLAGPQGFKLVEWLEQNTAERKRMLETMDEILRVLHASMGTTTRV